ncbi:MAG: peptidoglycan D,D-transpeptidase FtsI family protein [Ostreibacterium sp.]
MKKFVSRYGATTRRNVVLLLLMLSAITVLGRVMFLQVYHADFLVKQGNSRFVRIKKEPALRGSILDRNAVPLAVSTPVSSIWVNPKEISEDPASIVTLAHAIGYPLNQLQKKISKRKQSSFLYIRRDMEPALAKQVIAKKLPGVYSLREYSRFYPSADVTSQVIGFNDIDDEGQEGIELLYNDWLSGKSGSSEIIRDPSGRVVDILEEIKPPVQGQGLMLTIDKRLQYLTYLSLLEAIEKFKAASATAVMLDAKTSEVLAMVSVPSGNPNNAQEKKTVLLKNRAMTDTFEPGSVMKPFVVATALDAGLVHPNTPIDTEPGRLKIGKYLVRDTHDYGKLTVETVIKKSSNVGVCKIALRMPKEKLHAMYSALGFGAKSDIDFPGEQSGKLRDMSHLGDFEYCTNAYGYGISVTALQLAEAYAVLANNGVRIPPSLIKRESLPIGKRLISKRTTKQVRKMLGLAVAKGGTGTRATLDSYMQDYSVGGKTGTVHKVVGGKYEKKDYRAIFAGMAPLNDPRVVMVVMVDDPKGGQYYGGLVAAPVFAKVVGKTLRIMGVAPDKKPEITQKIIQVADKKNFTGDKITQRVRTADENN